ncbi:NAD(P)/FAD-dependent oxidoreductase [Croceibacterium aestuarii]|uniref:NAD(P)/FAD-dependent oxidoreductase n=1 Tax=Croceibacterium aestuarii TaxID=3064139 RepID=UPI00272E7FAF|nr:FAD-dependent monooxygenase [Croceibacterium sp. D39]
MSEVVVLGAGPAGCAAAIELGRGGGKPVLIDRNARPGDALCGGFLSWRTAQRLGQLGCSPEELGAHRVDTLMLYGPGRSVNVTLSQPCWGLSRHALDTRLRALASEAGSTLEVDTIREVDGLELHGRSSHRTASALFLASGKHDVRGSGRPREAADPALGLRLRIQPSAGLARRLAGRIELHLFPGGYAGIVLQEDGAANICMALRKSLFAAHGGDPRALLGGLARTHPHFGLRLEPHWAEAQIDTIGAVPYGWSTAETRPGVFRVGDQCAVIPSLAGEGIDIAVASGMAAAKAWLTGGPRASTTFQADFHSAVTGPIRWAGAAWQVAERPAMASAALSAVRFAPSLLEKVILATRLA